MNNSFQNIIRLEEKLFFHGSDANDTRLGDIVRTANYETASIVIIGCPQDEGVKRGGGREGARLAPDAIRKQFYELTNFGINKKIFDLGNIDVSGTLEQIHDAQTEIVSQILNDGKKVIVLGGGNDISYPNGRAAANVFGAENWIAISLDSHFDVRADAERSSATHYRQLLEEKLIRPDYLYQAGFQSHLTSPIHYRFLRNAGVNLISLEQLRSREKSDTELREQMRLKFINHSQSLTTFFGFDLTSVRGSDAPGVTASSPIGLRAGEFLNLVSFAAKLVNTRLIEFSEVNPNFDVDDRTTKLVAIAMHRFCSSI